jgi:diacylglycerol kinase (ATP)
MMDRLLVYWNPKAGGGKSGKVHRLVCRMLEKEHLTYTSTERAADAARFAEEGPCTIMAIGGDGTFNYLINHLPLRDDVVLLPISAGSGNDLARMLHRTLNPARQLQEALHHGKKGSMDVWKVNKHRFLEACGMGFDGLVASKAASLASLFPSPLRYSLTVARHIFTAKAFPARILANGEEVWNGPLFMASVGNGFFAGGGYKLWPQARLDDGKMDVLLIGKINIIQRLLYVLLVRSGAHVKLRVTRYFQTEKLELHSTQTLKVHTDGEPMEGNNFMLEKVGSITCLGTGRV